MTTKKQFESVLGAKSQVASCGLDSQSVAAWDAFQIGDGDIELVYTVLWTDWYDVYHHASAGIIVFDDTEEENKESLTVGWLGAKPGFFDYDLFEEKLLDAIDSVLGVPANVRVQIVEIDQVNTFAVGYLYHMVESAVVRTAKFAYLDSGSIVFKDYSEV